jgi:uncharacterized NAD(P)/FAD-binding protein YdhS
VRAVRSIAIIGAGFCGTMVAVHLLRAKAPPAEIALIEGSGRFTAGVAYGTPSPSHVLNVPAGRMSAFPDDADHFLRWARVRDARVGGGSFVARATYGSYLRALLDESEAARPDVKLTRVPRAARGLSVAEGEVRVALDGGELLRADHTVLAIGNFPPGSPDPALDASSRYVHDPWAAGALDVEPGGDVLLLGTGLTMLDIAVALKESGLRGTIHAVSRRGLLPQPHRVSITPPRAHPRPKTLDEWPRTARGLLCALRREVRAAASRGVDWREVVTSLRHDTPALWRSLPPRERARFLAHVRPYWETHRHRAAPETATAIAEHIARGELVVHAARLAGHDEDATGITVRLRDRGAAAERSLRVARIINCTGPETDVRRVDDPLVADLLQGRLVRADGLGLGLDTDDRGALLAADGTPSEHLSLLGPLRKGLLWENTAVPELRVEALALARRLLADVTF